MFIINYTDSNHNFKVLQYATEDLDSVRKKFRETVPESDVYGGYLNVKIARETGFTHEITYGKDKYTWEFCRRFKSSRSANAFMEKLSNTGKYGKITCGRVSKYEFFGVR